MPPTLRLPLLVAAVAALPALGWAGDRSDDGEGEPPPSIHRRAAPAEDVGKPPAFVLSSSGSKDCRSRRESLQAHLAFKNQKMVWNSLKIASVGASYRIEACRKAEKDFDEAAELSDKKGAGRAFEKASSRVFESASACRRAFDDLVASECADADDAGCKTAAAERREVEYLDDQNRRFAKDLESQQAKLTKAARCADGEPAMAAEPEPARRAPAEPGPRKPAVTPQFAGFAAILQGLRAVPRKRPEPAISPKPASGPMPPPPVETPASKNWWDRVKEIGRDKIKKVTEKAMATARTIREKVEEIKTAATSVMKSAAAKAKRVFRVDPNERARDVEETLEELCRPFGDVGSAAYCGYISKCRALFGKPPSGTESGEHCSQDPAKAEGIPSYLRYWKFKLLDAPAARQRFVTPQKDPNRPAFDAVNCAQGIYECQSILARNKKLKGELFLTATGDEWDIDPRDVSQGSAGDCYFLASLAAIANRQAGRDLVRRNITSNGDGTFSVTFYRDQQPRIISPVDTLLPVEGWSNPVFAEGSKANGKRELWVMVAEKAYAMSNGNGSYNGIGNGGSSDRALAAITGQPSTRSDPAPPFDDLADWNVKGQAIIVGTPRDPSRRYCDANGENCRLVGTHAYWVKDVDAKAGSVTLGNPWGWDRSDGEAKLSKEEYAFVGLRVYANPIR